MNALSALFSAYITSGLAFFFVHVLLLVFFFNQIRLMVRTSSALSAWNPVGPGYDADSPTALLDEFIAEVQSSGADGQRVALSEHLQRIQERAAGAQETAHDYSNYMLLVGIAGTLASLFTFSLKVSALAGETLTSQMGLLLADALRQAFPVAFFGVVLSVLTAVIASWFAAQSERALSKAIGKALAFRREHSRSGVDTTREVALTIRASLEPLAQLQETLQKGLSPVVERLGSRLDSALQLVQQQFAELSEYQAGLKKSMMLMRAAAESVEKATSHVAPLQQSIDQHVSYLIARSDQFVKFSEAHQQKLEDLARSSDATLDAAARLTDKVDDVLDRLSSVTDRTGELPERIASELRVTTTEFYRSLSSQVDEINRKAEGAFDRVRASGTEIERIRQNATSLVDRVVEVAKADVEQWMSQYIESSQRTAASLDEASKRIQTAFDTGASPAAETNAALELLHRELRQLKAAVNAMATSTPPVYADQLGVANAHLAKIVQYLDASKAQLISTRGPRPERPPDVPTPTLVHKYKRKGGPLSWLSRLNPWKREQP